MGRATGVCLRVLLSAFFLCGLTFAGEASDDVIRELSERLDMLEQENMTLKTEIKRLNEKVDGVA